jgi:hypothetical protein
MHPLRDNTRRNSVVTWFAILCFLAAPAIVFLSYLSLPNDGTSLAPFGPLYWAQLAVSHFLELFANPGNIGGLLALQRHGVLHDFLRSRAFMFEVTPVLALACVVLGWALFTMQEWARWATVLLCGLKIALVVANIAVYGEQFTYCLEGTILHCGQNVVEALLPHYGFSIAGAVISAALVVFFWRSGLSEQIAAPGSLQEKGTVSGPLQFRLHRWTIVILACLVNVQYLFAARFLVLFSLHGHRPDAIEMGPFAGLVLFAIAGYTLVAFRLARRTDLFAFALAFSAGICLIFARTVVWTHNLYFPISFFSGFGAWILDSYTQAIYAYADVMYAVHILISIVAAHAIWKMRLRREASFSQLTLALLIPFVVVLLWPQIGFEQRSFAAFPARFVPSPQQQAQNRQRDAAQKLVQAYGRCAFFYRQSHPAVGFPSASEIGTVVGCLNAEQSGAHLDGYGLHYSASEPDATGVRQRFAAAATKAATADRNSGGFYMDETGLLSMPVAQPSVQNIAQTEPGSQPSTGFERGSLVSFSIGYLINRFHSCLAQIAARDPRHQFPPNLEPLLEEKAGYGNPCINSWDLASFSRSDLKANHFIDGKYVFDYAPVFDNSHLATGYRMTARPEHYIQDGMRSYFIDETGVLRATPDNRIAAPFDGEAFPCEMSARPCTDPVLMDSQF